MGDWGSGNRLYERRRHTCDEYLPLDIRHLEKKGALVSGRLGDMDIRWGKQRLYIHFEPYPHVLRLKFRYTRSDGTRADALYAIELDRTPQRLGGKRSWFKCPEPFCGRRCRILYFKDRFACRTCHGLAYTSQRQSPENRAFSQARKIRRLLGGPASLDEPFPDKPAGMHQSTYERLRERHDEYIQRGNDAPWDRMMAPILKALN